MANPSGRKNDGVLLDVTAVDDDNSSAWLQHANAFTEQPGSQSLILDAVECEPRDHEIELRIAEWQITLVC